MSQDLKLLVEWSSPWEEFKTAIRPAFVRSPKALAGEAKSGLFPLRGMVGTCVAEIALFALFILATRGLDSMHPFQPPTPPKYDVIYYTGNELPRIADAGGAQTGHTGRSGGREAHHPTQVIHVARGESVREKVVDAPRLNLPRSDAAVANLLAYKRVPGPPPSEGMLSSRRPLIAPQVAAIPPAPEVDPSRMRSQPTLSATVVAPAPSAQNIEPLRLPGSHPMEVVPPPVSAPERVSTANPKLTMPAPQVVAPAPTQVTRELAVSGPGFGPGDPHKQVVPPPAQLNSAMGTERHSASGLGNSEVVPPSVQLAAGSTAHQPVSGLDGGMGVVPPPPTVGGGTSLTGRGHGARGQGLGGLGEIGDVAAPPNSGGTNGKGAGVVVSNQPGSKVGVPSGGAGSLAMSPTGTANSGLGGSGGGASIGRGAGPGSGFSGEGPGGGKQGSGRGSDPSARGGISPSGGPGGTGSGDGSPAMPGVSVSGGTGVVNLPSFSGEPAPSGAPGRSSTGLDDRPGLTVEASSRSGGAFNFYGMLKGDKVYTIYIDTVLGTAVLEFADPTSAAHPNQRELMPPQPMRADLPAGVRRSRLVIACVVDRDGAVRNVQVIESAGPAMASKVLAALPAWKFRPATRGNQPVEVNAILGFDIDTSDR